MKLYFTLGIALVTILIASLLGYAVYLNERGENQITERMENLRLPVMGAKAERRALSPQKNFELINLYADTMTDVVARESGRIAQMLVKKEEHVQAGTPLFKLTDEDIHLKIRQIDSDIVEAEANLLKAENSYQRYKQLVEVNAVSLEKYDEAAAYYKAAVARLENYRVQREQMIARQERLLITSPIEGDLLLIYKSPGSYVQSGTVVALVGDFSHLYFTVPMEGWLAQQLYVGMEAELDFISSVLNQRTYGGDYGAGNKGDNQVYTARVTKITPSPEEPADARQVVWEIDNQLQMLEPGTYTRAILRLHFSRECLTVPVEAFLHRSNDEVSVLTADGTLAIRKVQAGITDGKYVEIISGLSEGDVVITSDTEGIKEGTPVSVTLVDEEGNGYAG